MRRPSRERTLEIVLVYFDFEAGDRACDVPNDLAVDSARDAVLELEAHLGDGVLGEDGGIRYITCKMARLAHSFWVITWPVPYRPGIQFQEIVEALAIDSGILAEARVTYGWQRTRPCCGW